MTAKTPVIIGVGDCINRSLRPEDAIEPLDLIVSALQKAFTDAAGPIGTDYANLLKRVDSVDVVATWTWPYPDLPGLVAEKLGLKNANHKATSAHGGNQPAKLLDEAARRISQGECEVAIICGGEALGSRTDLFGIISWQILNCSSRKMCSSR
jgi:acetyl-CoA acetyltransferase